MLSAVSLTHQAATQAWSLTRGFPDKPKRWRIRPICANASLVRSLMRRASNSATLAIIVSSIRPALVVASISGRSQQTKPPIPFFSASLASFKPRPTGVDRSCARSPHPQIQTRSQPPSRPPSLEPSPFELQGPIRSALGGSVLTR